MWKQIIGSDWIFQSIFAITHAIECGNVSNLNQNLTTIGRMVKRDCDIEDITWVDNGAHNVKIMLAAKLLLFSFHAHLFQFLYQNFNVNE